MNIIGGILRLDGQSVCRERLTECHFQSPMWSPDHQFLFLQPQLGFICTQRFMTPECHHAPMPYQHPDSRCVVVADIYLSNRAALLADLALDKGSADVELLAAAYLKWGAECVRHLQGPFMFAIWDADKQTLFVATDHSGTRPCLYSYVPGKYFIFANHLAPFRHLCPTLTLNETFHENFTLDYLPDDETCYKEVRKILPAHYLRIEKNNFQSHRYWRIEKQANRAVYKTRDDYYQAFRELFANTVQQYMRSDYPITAQISGGLDSSSVACMAAKLLAEKNQSLHTFTAIPQGLEGPSFRRGWYYHEMPRVNAALQQYPNMLHQVYQASASTDPLEKLSLFYPFIDQPLRNVFNLDWILACLDYAAAHNGRYILWGSKGNATISWSGCGIRQIMSGINKKIRLFFEREKLFGSYFNRHHADFLRRKQSRDALWQLGSRTYDRAWILNSGAGRQSSFRPILFWHGVDMLDPTGDVKIMEFCYNLPEWVYFKGRDVLQRRLLVREGLIDIVPEAIRLNPYRGEQSADAYLQYNQHRLKWREKILQITKNKPDHLLWRIYDKQKMLGLFEEFKDISAPNMEVQLQIYANLLRFLSLGYFLDFLD